MTLTTERQQFEEWLKFHSDEEECTNLLQRNSAGTNYLHPHADLAWIAWQASRELLAHREAQPVAWQETLSRAAKAFEALLETAGHFDKYVWADVPAQLRALTVPPAPSVPDEATAENVEALSGYVSTYKMTESERDIAAEVWNACRAAMLAQPVSQGYKLPPHAYRELVNSLRDTAAKYHGTQQLREQLSRTLTENGLVAAAPGGGNDHDTRR